MFRNRYREYSSDILEYGSESMPAQRDSVVSDRQTDGDQIFGYIETSHAQSGLEVYDDLPVEIYSPVTNTDSNNEGSRNQNHDLRSGFYQQRKLEQSAAERGVGLPGWLKVIAEPDFMKQTSRAQKFKGNWTRPVYIDAELVKEAINETEIQPNAGEFTDINVPGANMAKQREMCLNFFALDSNGVERVEVLSATQVDVLLKEGSADTDISVRTVYMVDDLPDKLEAIFSRVSLTAPENQVSMTEAFDQEGNEAPRSQLQLSSKPNNPAAGTTSSTRNNYTSGSFMDEVRQRAIDGLFGTSTYEAAQPAAPQPSLEISDDDIAEVVDRELGLQTPPQPTQARRVVPTGPQDLEDVINEEYGVLASPRLARVAPTEEPPVSTKPSATKQPDVNGQTEETNLLDEKESVRTNEYTTSLIDSAVARTKSDNIKNLITEKLPLNKRPRKRTVLMAVAALAVIGLGINKSNSEEPSGAALNVAGTNSGETKIAWPEEGAIYEDAAQIDGSGTAHIDIPFTGVNKKQGWYQDPKGLHSVDLESRLNISVNAQAKNAVTIKPNGDDGLTATLNFDKIVYSAEVADEPSNPDCSTDGKPGHFCFNSEDLIDGEKVDPNTTYTYERDGVEYALSSETAKNINSTFESTQGQLYDLTKIAILASTEESQKEALIKALTKPILEDINKIAGNKELTINTQGVPQSFTDFGRPVEGFDSDILHFKGKHGSSIGLDVESIDVNVGEAE